MDQPITHPSNLTPFDFREPGPYLIRNLLHGFTDKFETANKGALKDLVFDEIVTINPRGPSCKEINFHENMAKICVKR